MQSVWSVSKLSTESVGSRRELVANCVHTADAMQLDSYVAPPFESHDIIGHVTGMVFGGCSFETISVSALQMLAFGGTIGVRTILRLTYLLQSIGASMKKKG